MKISSLKPGMVVYSVTRQKMGNTTISTVAVHHVTIESVDLEHRTVVASWNCNPPRKYREREIARWRAKKPVLMRGGFGRLRLATREEIKAMREN